MSKTLPINKNVIYDVCATTKNTAPEQHVDESVKKKIAANFRVLPTFEKSLYEEVHRRRLSLQNNERLKCCWQQYKKNIETKEMAPFQFPNVRDLHYSRYAIEFVPNENKYKLDNRRKLRPGPGVDDFGQMPIPQELLMRRSGDVKEATNRSRDKINVKQKKTKQQAPDTIV